MAVLFEQQLHHAIPAPDLIAVIARHDHIKADVAAAKAIAFLQEPWGHAAIRQMVWDVLCQAKRRGQLELIDDLRDLYRRICVQYPNHHDRRTSPARITHPFPLPPDWER